MNCANKPCQNGGKCEAVVKACSQCAAFKCNSPAPFTGPLSNQYKRCYLKARRCFVTEYRKDTFKVAGQRCIDLGNLSRPAITSYNIETAFRKYIRYDPTGKLEKDYVWLGAQSQPYRTNDTRHWTWLDGVSTSIRLSYLHCLFLFIAFALPPPQSLISSNFNRVYRKASVHAILRKK